MKVVVGVREAHRASECVRVRERILADGHALVEVFTTPRREELDGKTTEEPNSASQEHPSWIESCERTIDSGTASDELTMPDQRDSAPVQADKNNETPLECG